MHPEIERDRLPLPRLLRRAVGPVPPPALGRAGALHPPARRRHLGRRARASACRVPGHPGHRHPGGRRPRGEPGLPGPGGGRHRGVRGRPRARSWCPRPARCCSGCADRSTPAPPGGPGARRPARRRGAAPPIGRQQVRAAASPCACSGAATVVSPGVTSAAAWMLSKPTTLTSCGTRTPQRGQAADDADRDLVVVGDAPPTPAGVRSCVGGAQRRRATSGANGPTRRTRSSSSAPTSRSDRQRIAVGPRRLRAGDVGDRVVPEREPGARPRRRTPAALSSDHARDVGDRAVQHDHRLLLGHHADRRVGHAASRPARRRRPSAARARGPPARCGRTPGRRPAGSCTRPAAAAVCAPRIDLGVEGVGHVGDHSAIIWVRAVDRARASGLVR